MLLNLRDLEFFDKVSYGVTRPDLGRSCETLSTQVSRPGPAQTSGPCQIQSRSSADPESGSVQCPYLRLPNMGTIVRNKTYAVCVAVLGRELMITKKQLMSRLLLKFGDFKKMIKK